MNERTQNWIFLGDSLTEGVGSSRISYVTELAAKLRQDKRLARVDEFRLRRVDPDRHSRFVRFNIAGYLNSDARDASAGLWLWNLACEGQTIESDAEWLPLFNSIRPERVIIFRGGLESIIRPAALREQTWPKWVPKSWRSYAAMDPRCYFSTTWWRKAKQVGVDNLKQRVRLSLLRSRSGTPLFDAALVTKHYSMLIERLRELNSRILLLGLLPVSGFRFPGSPEQFQHVNAMLRELAALQNVDFLDWGAKLRQFPDHEKLFYRDGFHPNLAGARALAKILSQHFHETGAL